MTIKDILEVVPSKDFNKQLVMADGLFISSVTVDSNYITLSDTLNEDDVVAMLEAIANDFNGHDLDSIIKYIKDNKWEMKRWWKKTK